MNEETEPWIAGLRRTDTRPVTPAEARHLERLHSMARRRQLVDGVAWLSGLAALLGAGFLMGTRTGQPWWWTAAFVFVVVGVPAIVHGFVTEGRQWRGLAGLLAGAVVAASCIQWPWWVGAGGDLPWPTVDSVVISSSAALLLLGWSHAVTSIVARIRSIPPRGAWDGDRRNALVMRFEGVLTPAHGDVAANLRRAGALVTGKNPRQRLVVLPRTGVLLTVNGRPARRLLVLEPVDVARPWPHALRVPVPNGVLRDRTSGTRRLNKRPLSPAERQELRRHARRLRRSDPHWSALAVGALAFASMGSWDAAAHGADGLFWLALGGGAVWIHVRKLVMARRLDHDDRMRWVATVDDEGVRPGRAAPLLEVLPVSHVAWTEGGEPAAWRYSTR